MTKEKKRKSFCIAGEEIKAGTRSIAYLPMPKLYSHTAMNMPVHVIHGAKEGPVLFVSAAIHGDELNGVEIVRRLLGLKAMNRLSGTVIAVPIVNAYGLIQISRYLPDGRDLNRSFPGSSKGSLAARLADVFMTEVVSRSDYGIDLHTGSGHRTNLPQIRANLDDPKTEELARCFGVPVLLNSSLRDGSLRAAASELGVTTLLYEAGEALRYHEISIRAGVSGILHVMRHLGMLTTARTMRKSTNEPYIAQVSRWQRAPESGMLRTIVKLGAEVKRGDILGYIDDSFSSIRHTIFSNIDGVVVGRLELPIVHEGDAVYHIAGFDGDDGDVVDQVEAFSSVHSDLE